MMDNYYLIVASCFIIYLVSALYVERRFVAWWTMEMMVAAVIPYFNVLIAATFLPDILSQLYYDVKRHCYNNVS
jgi:hypothetical protein